MEEDKFKVVKLLGNLTNSLIGNTNIFDSNYVDDVKRRLPNIEKAFYELKDYFQNEEKPKC